MSDLKFSLDAEDTSLLAQYAIGASLSSEVRVVRNIYRNNENGYSIYDAEDTSYRLLKLSGYFPTPLRLWVLQGPWDHQERQIWPHPAGG